LGKIVCSSRWVVVDVRRVVVHLACIRGGPTEPEELPPLFKFESLVLHAFYAPRKKGREL
jgi:hypothetical protein